MKMFPNWDLGWKWRVADLVTLPLSAVFYMLVGIVQGLEWLYNKLAGEK